MTTNDRLAGAMQTCLAAKSHEGVCEMVEKSKIVFFTMLEAYLKF